MTPQEFKAWFDGFNEGVDDVPTEKQWKKIKERVGQIDNTPVTLPVYIERYRPYWRDYSFYTTRDTRAVSNGGCSSGVVLNQQLSNISGPGNAGSLTASPPRHSTFVVTATSPFDSLKAMNDLGRADIDECVE